MHVEGGIGLMGRQILIVDDSASIRQMVTFTLKEAGYEVIEAVDGKDALAKLSGAPAVGMIITDLNMPNLDGIGLIQRRAGAQPPTSSSRSSC